MRTRWTRTNRTYRRWEDLPGHIWPEGSPNEDSPREQSYSNVLVYSENHGHQNVKRLGRHDAGNIGGDFLVRRRFYDERPLRGNTLNHFSPTSDPTTHRSPHVYSGQWARYDQFSDWAFPMPSPLWDSQMAPLGTTAIARMTPTKPKADLSTFLAEAREGIPAAVGMSMTGYSRARQARNAGDEYLNVEFGWKPLVRDVRSFANSVRNSNELLRKFHEDSGKLLRREYRFPVELDVKVESLGHNYPAPRLHPSLYSSGPPELLRTRTTKTEIWVTATFQYYVPPVSEKFGRFTADANHLLGVKLTPETLWNAAPWSWAADWVANTGDVMSNLSRLSQDSLTIHHAYVMCTKTITDDYTMDCSDFWNSYPGSHSLRQTFTGQTKQRMGATPYGFGLSWDGFSDQQLGILAALGVTKAHS